MIDWMDEEALCATALERGAEGIFHGLPFEEYKAAPGVSHSMLKHMEPPARLPVYLASPPKATIAMLTGSEVHHLALSPNDKRAWALAPEDYDGRTTAGKEWKKSVGDMQILPFENQQDAQGCFASIQKSPACQRIFAEGRAEVSVFKNVYGPDGSEILAKARIDWVPMDGDYLVDIKTCERADYESFLSEVEKRKYFLQAAFYLDIWNAATGENRTQFRFIAVEKAPPYLVAVWPIEADYLRDGREEYQDLLARYIRCAKSNTWPGHECFGSLKRPGWARAKREQETKRLMEAAATNAVAGLEAA